MYGGSAFSRAMMREKRRLGRVASVRSSSEWMPVSAQA